MNDLTEITGASQSNVSQHLALMRQRQIVKTRKAGSNIYYRVASPKISQACDMVREVLMEQLSQKQELAKGIYLMEMIENVWLWFWMRFRRR